jgi:hypothetical protein
VLSDFFHDLPSTITALATLTAAIGALIVAIVNARSGNAARDKAVIAAAAAEDSKKEVVLVRGEVIEVGKRIDGRLSELLKTTEALARAQGRAERRQQQKHEVTAETKPEPTGE